MKQLMIIVAILLSTSVTQGQIPYETLSIQRTGNRETYIGRKGYVGHSVVRNGNRVYSNKNGVYSRQYKDGSGTTRFQPLGSPARSASSRGFTHSK